MHHKACLRRANAELCRATTQASGYGPLKPASARTTCYKPVSVGISTTVTAGLGNQADGTRLFDPLLGREDEAVEARLFFNPIEFDGIKTGVVELFPDAEKLNGVAIAEPVLDGDTAPVRHQHTERGEIEKIKSGEAPVRHGISDSLACEEVE